MSINELINKWTDAFVENEYTKKLTSFSIPVLILFSTALIVYHADRIGFMEGYDDWVRMPIAIFAGGYSFLGSLLVVKKTPIAMFAYLHACTFLFIGLLVAVYTDSKQYIFYLLFSLPSLFYASAAYDGVNTVTRYGTLVLALLPLLIVFEIEIKI